MRAARGNERSAHASRAPREEEAEEAARTARLSRIELCGGCQGHRLEKVVYNGSMVLERTCSRCGGEGVIVRADSGVSTNKASEKQAANAGQSAERVSEGG